MSQAFHESSGSVNLGTNFGDRKSKPGDGTQTEGIGQILGGLLGDLQQLVRGEISLAKAEIREDLGQAGSGIGRIAAGALVGVTGFIFLMLGVTYVLNLYMRMWIAAGAVGLTLLVIAMILAMSGKKTLSATNLKPTQTIESLQENQQWAKQQMSSVKQ